jgi:hypothetical protein
MSKISFFFATILLHKHVIVLFLEKNIGFLQRSPCSPLVYCFCFKVFGVSADYY